MNQAALKDHWKQMDGDCTEVPAMKGSLGKVDISGFPLEDQYTFRYFHTHDVIGIMVSLCDSYTNQKLEKS